MKKTTIFLVVLLSLSAAAYAHTSMKVDRTCPICAHEFTCEIDASGTQFGSRLDLKPLGPTPAPWRVPVCPKCHFVLYNDLTDEEIPAEELTKCKEIVQSDAYQKHTDRASYFLIGLLYEGLGREPLDIGHTFLKASWQEESDKKNLKDDLERSLKYFELYLKSTPEKTPQTEGEEEDDTYPTAQILKGELLRRLSRFEESKSYLTELQNLKEFQDTFLGNIVAYEIRLCENKDSKPHDVSEIEDIMNSEPIDSENNK